MKPIASLKYINCMIPLILNAALLASVVPFDSVGPLPPKVKGLNKTLADAPTVSLMVRATMRDFTGGAVVVVEDELPRFNQKLNTGVVVFDGKLRFLKPVLGQSYGLPVPVWMNPNVVMSGGNIVQRSYAFGWGY
jgi:hypothetical protein